MKYKVPKYKRSFMLFLKECGLYNEFKNMLFKYHIEFDENEDPMDYIYYMLQNKSLSRRVLLDAFPWYPDYIKWEKLDTKWRVFLGDIRLKKVAN